MIGNWERWEPLKGVENKYWIKSVSNEFGELNIILSGDKDANNRVQVLFKKGAQSYMLTDETCQNKLICLLKEKYGGNFYGKWTFFIVSDSPYVKYLSEQSFTFSDCMQLKHFVLIAADSVMNIISTREPEVTFVVD